MAHGIARRIHDHLKLLSLLAVCTVLAACAVVSDRYAEYTTTPEARRNFHAEIFDSAWSQVEEKYFDSTFNGQDWHALGEKYRERAISSVGRESLYRVMNTMFAELGGSHLQAIPPRQMQQVRSGTYQGFGFQFLLYDGQAIVREVYAGSSAELAGVEPGWLFVALGGIRVPQALTDLSVDPSQSYLHTFLDENDQAREVVLSIQAVNRPGPVSQRIADNLVYVRFDQFNKANIKWLNRELKAASAVASVVVDLRSNSGGDEFALRRAIREFFQENVVRSGHIISSGGNQKGLYSAYPFTAEYAGAVYVLTSESSASSAEIFAHVLQSYGRATVIGSKKAGKVLRSRIYRLPDSGFLQIPLYGYLGLDGEGLEGRGVIPDIEIPRPSVAQLRRGEDLALEKAVSLAGANSSSTAN